MNDEARALRWAKNVWQSGQPTETEICAGADRIARRLATSKGAWTLGRTWATSVAAAALLGAIGYAGRGAWREGTRSSSGRERAPDKVEVERKAGGTLDAPIPHYAAAAPTAPNAEGDQAEEPHPLDTTSEVGESQVAEPRSKVPLAHPSAEPTWMDVSDALALRDHARAEKLLLELASRGGDANTRAKAHLGLAQLEEGRKNCDAARQHALRAAAIPDVEIKTVRRALELAARCAR